jgi:hypothetical protein
MKNRAAGNPNICVACCCDVPETIDEEKPDTFEPRMRVSDEPHRSRRRSPAVGDHSHERKTSPSLPRRKH